MTAIQELHPSPEQDGGSMEAPTVTVERHPQPARPASNRAAALVAGVRIEQLTIGWMVVEAAAAIAAGIVAGSVLLTTTSTTSNASYVIVFEAASIVTGCQLGVCGRNGTPIDTTSRYIFH